MSINNDSLDFEFVLEDESAPAQGSLKNDPKLQEVSRKSYRLPLQKLNKITVQINGLHFDLINIVAHDRTGLGIRLKGGEPLELGQQLSEISFKLDDTDYNVQGRVQHISPDGLGNYLCGIELMQLSPEDKQRLHTFIEKLRLELFQENE